MNITIPIWAVEHFWEEPPLGHEEFWAFRFKPRCQVGDPILFRLDGQVVARAKVARIERPGQSRCEGTGRFANRWKVFWKPDLFKDLREKVKP